MTLEAATRIEIPRRLRALVRARESSLVGLAAIVGAIAGVVVAVMGDTVDMLHEIFFRLAPGERLSGRLTLDPWLAMAVPVIGGILFGIASEVLRRWRPNPEIDPIEANALHGGRMSLRDSLMVAIQTIISNGAGASVGLEAAYAQIGGVSFGLLVVRAFAPRRSVELAAGH